MKKRALILLSAILILFTSCDLFVKQPPKSKIYFIACGMGFQNSPYNALDNPLRDAKAMVGQFQELCKAGGNEYEIIWYSDDQSAYNGYQTAANSPRRFTLRHIVNGKEMPTELLYSNSKLQYLDQNSFIDLFFGKIDEMFTTTPTENDLIIFYFSGHGEISLYSDDVGGPYLYYGTAEDPLHLNQETLVSVGYDRIFREMNSYRCRQFYIFDCCYSGGSVDNPSESHGIYDHDLGTVDSFSEYTSGAKRDDAFLGFNIFNFIGSAAEHTFDYYNPGIPNRICLNASNYGQMAMDHDVKKEPNITNYGGMTYRILKYLGYDMVHDRPAYPNLSKKTVSAGDLYMEVYNKISDSLRESSTPNITRTSYDMLLWDLR